MLLARCYPLAPSDWPSPLVLNIPAMSQAPAEQLQEVCVLWWQFSYQYINTFKITTWNNTFTFEIKNPSLLSSNLQLWECTLSVCEREKAWERQTHLPHLQSVAYICGTLSSTWCCYKEFVFVNWTVFVLESCLSQLSWLHSRHTQESYTAAAPQWPLFWRSSSFVLLMSVVHGVKSSPLCQWVSAVFLLFSLAAPFFFLSLN